MNEKQKLDLAETLRVIEDDLVERHNLTTEEVTYLADLVTRDARPKEGWGPRFGFTKIEVRDTE